MNCAYRLIWNEDLDAWVVAPEIASARGKRSSVKRSVAALLLAALAIASHATLAADLAATALPGGGQVTAGQANISSAGTNMAINQSSQRAIINWQNFNIGSQASVNFQQPNSSAVTLNRAGGATASRIEGQLTANGQVFLINPNGVLFGSGARVNVGGLVASTLNIRDQDFLTGNYAFTGTGGTITNQGEINASAGGYVAFIAPSIVNHGSISAPQGTVALGAGDNVRLNFAGDRLVSLNVSASQIDTLIENHQAIRAAGGAILLTAAAAEGLTNGVINNTGLLEASSLTSKGGVIRLEGGLASNTGRVAVDGVNGGEITVNASEVRQGGSTSATGSAGAGGTVKLLGDRVALMDGATVDVSGATGGGTVLVGGDYQGKNPQVRNALRTWVAPTATIKADAVDRGEGGKVVVWADEITRYYGSISAMGGTLGGNGGFVEVSGKQNLDFHGAVNVAAPLGIGGQVLLDPQDIVLNTSTQLPPPNNANGTPDVAFADLPAAGTTTVQISDVTDFSELFLQATRDITVSNPVTMAANNSIRLEANNNITLATGANIATSGTGSINLKADADNSGTGTLVMNNATLRSRVGGITLAGASISGTGTVNTTGTASTNGGNISISGTSTAGSISLTGAMTSSGGAAAAGTTGRNAGNVTISGAGTVTTGAITASGSNGSGAGQAGGNGGVITVTSNGALTTGNLAASGGNGVATAAGGNAGTIAVTNNSTTTGTLTTGALTARTGIARGAIVSGSAGAISITNKAATLLRTAAINTSGQAGGAGGDVTLTSAGDVNVTSTIVTSGGALVAGTTAAGRNAGNVTISGVNRSLTGAITASGGAALGTNQTGGNAGTVLLSGTGTLATAAITSRTGGATGTGAGGTVGGITLNGTTVSAGALTTTGGANANGGNISVTSTTGDLGVAAIATSGGAANTGTAGRNAGAVTLNSAGSITVTTITASGSNGSGAGQAGGNGGAINVDSNGTLVTGNLLANGGNGVATAAGGNGGTIAVTNNSTSGGNLTTGTLTARAGAAAGAIVSGNAGSVAVNNKAATLLRTAAINTSGQASGAGGDVTLTSAGDVNVTGAITTSGGTANAGTAGRSAGAVTLNSAGGITATTITASGSNGSGAGQAGGNGGVISVTSNGTLTTGNLLANGGNGVATAAGGNGGTIAVTNNSTSGGNLTTGTLTARAGAAAGAIVSGNAGSVAVNNKATTLLQTTTINTSGQAGGAGGDVTLTSAGDVTVTSTIATSGGALVAGTTAAGRNAGNVTIGGAGSVTTAAITASGGAALGTNQSGGNGGNISLDAGGATPLITIGGNLSAVGGNRTGTGTAGSGGNITIADTLNIGAANRTISSRGGSTGVGAGGDITLGGPIYDSGERTLTVTGGSGTVSVAGGSANATLANNLDTLIVTASDGAGKIRVGSVNTIAAQSYDAGTGGIELNGNVATLGSAGPDTVTFSDPVTLTGNSSITTAGGTDDNIAISQTVNGPFGLTLNAGTLGNVTTSNIIGGNSALSAFSATGAAVTFGQSVTAGSIFARSTTGNLTLNPGTVLTGTGTDNAIELVAGGTASRFINNAGAGALNASNAAGRFLVWSQNPANDTRGGLAYAFKQYNATCGVTPVADTTANNDGFLYVLAPTLTPGLTGTVTKVYDATTTAPLAPTNFTSTSGVDGDVIAMSGTGAFDNPNVAGSPTKLVTASGIAATATSSIAEGSKPVYGYTLTSTTANANIGEITPAPLTVTGNTGNSTYTSNLQTNGFTTSGLLGSDSVTGVVTLGSGTNVGTYADNLTSATGSGLGNYTISYVNGSLQITPANLTISADDATKQVNTPNPQFTASYAGFVGGETPAVLNGVLSFSTPATLISPVGIYPITPYGQFSGNYTIIYVDGALTIQGVLATTQPPLPREVVSQQAIGAQYTDPTMSTDTLTGLQYAFEDDHESKDGKASVSVVRVVGPGIRLPN